MAWQAKPVNVTKDRNRVILTVEYQNTDDATQNFTENLEVQNMASISQLVGRIQQEIKGVEIAETYVNYLKSEITKGTIIQGVENR